MAEKKKIVTRDSDFDELDSALQEALDGLAEAAENVNTTLASYDEPEDTPEPSENAAPANSENAQ